MDAHHRRQRTPQPRPHKNRYDAQRQSIRQRFSLGSSVALGAFGCQCESGSANFKRTHYRFVSRGFSVGFRPDSDKRIECRRIEQSTDFGETARSASSANWAFVTTPLKNRRLTYTSTRRGGQTTRALSSKIGAARADFRDRAPPPRRAWVELWVRFGAPPC